MIKGDKIMQGHPPKFYTRKKDRSSVWLHVSFSEFRHPKDTRTCSETIPDVRSDAKQCIFRIWKKSKNSF